MTSEEAFEAFLEKCYPNRTYCWQAEPRMHRLLKHTWLAAVAWAEGRKTALRFPPHKASLHLTHNPHTANYESVEAYEASTGLKDSWVSPEQRALALEQQDFWVLQWYPDTPVGFYFAAAHDLETLLAATLREERTG